MSNKNSNLHNAKRMKDDEFYTTYETVESEVNHYASQLKNKVVLCNCDDPFNSNFVKYFLTHFCELKLKRLICTSFCISSPYEMQYSLFEEQQRFSVQKKGFLLDIKQGDIEKNFSISDFVKELNGDGDFRSPECIKYLKQADVVITNPPFSLFKEFVILMQKYNKRFLIIGNQNALTYKEIFPLIKNNQVWTGYQFGEMKFRVPAYSEPRATRFWIDETGQKWRSLGNAMWLTNLDNERRHQDLKLTKRFDSYAYPKYDNYDAIHVKSIVEIPIDYKGIMGVPITIINRYNYEQFEIIGEANHGSDNEFDFFKPTINGKEIFKRILIRNRNYERKYC